MNKPIKKKDPVKQKPSSETVVSLINGEQSYIEMLYAPRLEKSALGIWKAGELKVQSSHVLTPNKRLVPVSANNNLIKHNVLLFPSFAEEYKTESDLISLIQSFIHRYCDLGNRFETVTAHYVLLTWVYDKFRELPYLKMQGDYGTGKSRFLQVVGSLCYKPLFASGASTISPIFHALDTFQGTLVMDEADFKFSDEKADIVKILNNGNMRGFPLLRSEVSKSGTYNPKAFHVFGPKILATRGGYQDPALESRIITRRAKPGNIRKNIPLTLPDGFEQEAEALRNKLLMFRFRNWHAIGNTSEDMILKTGRRIAQIFRPLLAIAQDEKARQIIYDYAYESDAILKSSRAHSVEENLLAVIQELLESKKPLLSIKAISLGYQGRHGNDHTSPVTNKWIGGILRNRLHLSTIKRNGVYIIPETELPRITALLRRYDMDGK